jgi:hypothetical protein
MRTSLRFARPTIAVSFARKPRPFNASRSRFRLPRTPPATIVRVILLATFAIAASAWALAYHFTHLLPPLRVPVAPTAAPTYDADAGEIPVPELIAPSRD